MRITRTILLACCGLSIAGAASAASPVPTWQQLENSYAQDHGTGAALRDILAAIPPGTPLADAEQRFAQAGGSCRADRRKPDEVRCLIHQYDLGDGAADDVRWVTSIRHDGGVVTDAAIVRSVDRHGMS